MYKELLWKIDNLIQWLRKLAKEESAIGHFISGTYFLGNNVMFQFIATFIVPTIMSIGFHFEVSWLIYTSIMIFLFSSATMFISSSYNSKKRIDAEWFLASLNRTRDITHKINNNLIKLKNDFVEISNRGFESDDYDQLLKELRSYAGYNEIARSVCKEIYEMVNNVMKTKKCKVTVYHYDEEYIPDEVEHKRDCFRDFMIASYSDKGYEDISEIKYHYSDFYEENTNKQHLHIKIFKEKLTGVQICSNENEIKEKFLYHSNSVEREKKLKQYIGIPIYTEESDGFENLHNVYSVLQVDVEKENVFGQKSEEIEEFASNNLKMFSSLLRIAFEFDQLLKKIGLDVTENFAQIKKLDNKLYLRENDVNSYIPKIE